MTPAPVEQKRRTEAEAAQLRPRVLGGPLVAPPYRLPLAELAIWTEAHRLELARRHDKRAGELRIAGEEAWAAHGREERPVDAQWAKPGADVASGPRGAVARRFELRRDRGDDRPRFECLTHVERRRVRWERYLDKQGRARQKRVTRKVTLPAHVAHAAAERWHRQRADGQRFRAQQVAACGVGRIEVECHGCRARGLEHEAGWAVHEVPAYCGVVKLCPGCNIRRSMRARARFATSLEVVLRHAEEAGSFRLHQKGGALGQKMLTLTLPHFEVPEVVDDDDDDDDGTYSFAALWRVIERWRCATSKARVTALFEAGRHFTRSLQRYLREPWRGERQELVGACWSRAFEWTPGDDGQGHPHFHIWALEPWIPSYDEHKIESVSGGTRRPTTTCLAQHRVKGAWGWAETMRRERCELCAGAPAKRDAESRADWLDAYYETCRHPFRVRPLVKRRSGLHSWWADALGKAGVTVPAAKVNLDVREAYAHPVQAFREIRKPNGVNYQKQTTKIIEIRDSAGGVIQYFEGFSVSLQDADVWERAGVPVIAGVVEALEGRRLSQASKVNLRRSNGETFRVGFYGIADSFYGGECRDCKATGAEGIAKKTVKVISWQERARRHLRAPCKPEATAGPSVARAEGAELAELVHRLQVAERGGAVMRRLLDSCEAMRDIGVDALPIYQRGRVRTRPTERGFRARMRIAARLARKNRSG